MEIIVSCSVCLKFALPTRYSSPLHCPNSCTSTWLPKSAELSDDHSQSVCLVLPYFVDIDWDRVSSTLRPFAGYCSCESPPEVRTFGGLTAVFEAATSTVLCCAPFLCRSLSLGCLAAVLALDSITAIRMRDTATLRAASVFFAASEGNFGLKTNLLHHSNCLEEGLQAKTVSIRKPFRSVFLPSLRFQNCCGL